MFNCDLLYNFNNNYNSDDFYDLLIKFKPIGFRGPDNFGISMAADVLFSDYESKRSNAFAYIDKEAMSARLIMELRKSSIIRMPKDFFENHPDDSVKSVRSYRTYYLRPFLEDYCDEDWQYWWATRLFIPKINREDLCFVYEHLLEDGDTSKNNFGDPAKDLARKIIYGENVHKRPEYIDYLDD